MSRARGRYKFNTLFEWYLFIFLFMFFLFSDSRFAFAEWQRPKFNLSNIYRYLFREQQDIYIKRAELEFNYRREQDLFAGIKFSPFIEMRNNLERGRKLEQKEIGLELGVDIFDWLYLGESFQYTRYNYDWTNYIWHPRIKYAAEMETRFLLDIPIFKQGEDEDIAIYLFNEWLYSFKLGEGTRNESGLGLKIPINKYLLASTNWRHIDRIHDFDSDAIETTLTLVF